MNTKVSTPNETTKCQSFNQVDGIHATNIATIMDEGYKMYKVQVEEYEVLSDGSFLCQCYINGVSDKIMPLYDEVIVTHEQLHDHICYEGDKVMVTFEYDCENSYPVPFDLWVSNNHLSQLMNDALEDTINAVQGRTDSYIFNNQTTIFNEAKQKAIAKVNATTEKISMALSIVNPNRPTYTNFSL